VFEVGRQPEAGPAPMTFWVIGICNGLVDVTERRDAIIND
jgi:hypothetical protein